MNFVSNLSKQAPPTGKQSAFIFHLSKILYPISRRKSSKNKQSRKKIDKKGRKKNERNESNGNGIRKNEIPLCAGIKYAETAGNFGTYLRGGKRRLSPYCKIQKFLFVRNVL